MKYNLNSVNLQIRLLFLTVLFAVAGFALISPYADNSSYTEDSARVRFVLGQELEADSEPPIENPHSSDALISSFILILANAFTIIFLRSKSITPRLTFLYQIRPRSPPFP